MHIFMIIYDVVYTQQLQYMQRPQKYKCHAMDFSETAILATESHIHLLAITLGQAIAQPGMDPLGSPGIR